MRKSPLHTIPVLPSQANAVPSGPGAPRRNHTSPWHPRWLLAAPHRLGFFSASLVFSSSALWWAWVLLARAASVPLPWVVSPPAAHALLMTLGYMPLFMVGFMFTAGPKWLGMPEVEARQLAPAVALMLLGWLGAVPGFHWSLGFLGISLALVALGWTLLTLHFVQMIRGSRATDRQHAMLVGGSAAIGVLALWTASLSAFMGWDLALRSAAQLALWGFVAPVFAVVSHRMLPFFTASAMPMLDAWRPDALLWALVGLMALQVPMFQAELWFWPLPDALRWLQAAIELPAACALLWLALRWGLVQSMKIRLLAMLHAGFLWLGIAFALAGLSHLLMALTHGELSLGLAPTHALTMGYLGGSLLAMVTRVSSGHSGRPLAADNPVWVLYWLLHVSVLLRVLASLWPAMANTLLLTAVALWATVCMGWSWRYSNWYGRIRVDGKPG